MCNWLTFSLPSWCNLHRDLCCCNLQLILACSCAWCDNGWWSTLRCIQLLEASMLSRDKDLTTVIRQNYAWLLWFVFLLIILIIAYFMQCGPYETWTMCVILFNDNRSLLLKCFTFSLIATAWFFLPASSSHSFSLYKRAYIIYYICYVVVLLVVISGAGVRNRQQLEQMQTVACRRIVMSLYLGLSRWIK